MLFGRLANGPQYQDLWLGARRVAGQTLRSPDLQAVRGLRQAVVRAVVGSGQRGHPAAERAVSSERRPTAGTQAGVSDPRLGALLRQIVLQPDGVFAKRVREILAGLVASADDTVRRSGATPGTLHHPEGGGFCFLPCAGGLACASCEAGTGCCEKCFTECPQSVPPTCGGKPQSWTGKCCDGTSPGATQNIELAQAAGVCDDECAVQLLLHWLLMDPTQFNKLSPQCTAATVVDLEGNTTCGVACPAFLKNGGTSGCGAPCPSGTKCLLINGAFRCDGSYDFNDGYWQPCSANDGCDYKPKYGVGGGCKNSDECVGTLVCVNGHCQKQGQPSPPGGGCDTPSCGCYQQSGNSWKQLTNIYDAAACADADQPLADYPAGCDGVLEQATKWFGQC